MKLYNSLIKSMNKDNADKKDDTCPRRLSNDSTVPPSTTASSRRSSMATSLPDTNHESHDYTLDTDGTSFMISSVSQGQSSGMTSRIGIQTRNAPSKRGSKSQIQTGPTERDSDVMGAPRLLNRESSWGNLSIDDI